MQLLKTEAEVNVETLDIQSSTILFMTINITSMIYTPPLPTSSPSHNGMKVLIYLGSSECPSE